MEVLGKHQFTGKPEVNTGDKLVGIHESSSAPTVTDDSANGYYKGYIWVNTTNDTIQHCLDPSVGAAVWSTVNSAERTTTQEVSPASFIFDATAYYQVDLVAMGNDVSINAPTGGLKGLEIRIKIYDDGTPRLITWDAIFREIGTTLPTTTVSNKSVYISAVFNDNVGKCDILSVNQQV